jgi:hypothetical protein
MFGDARDSKVARLRPKRQNKVIKRQLSFKLSEPIGDRHSTGGEINRFDLPSQNRYAAKQFAKRIADVSGLKIAGYHLVKHWGEETEVISADKRHFDIGSLSCSPIQVPCGLHATESTTQNDDPRFFRSRLGNTLAFNRARIHKMSIGLCNVSVNRNLLIHQRFCVGTVSRTRNFTSFVKSNLLFGVDPVNCLGEFTKTMRLLQRANRGSCPSSDHLGLKKIVLTLGERMMNVSIWLAERYLVALVTSGA